MMKFLHTKTSCMSRPTDSKQRGCGRLLQRLATFAILFLCSMTISWAKATSSSLVIKDVTSPTITLNSETTTSQLSFTIKENVAENQAGTTLVTYYTTDGSDPGVESTSRKTLKESSETLTLPWAKGNTVKVRAFTKRVENGNAENYDYSKETIQDFYNTGSTDLPCLDDPVITPGDQAIVKNGLVENGLDVKISHDNWSSALSSKLKISYKIYERSENGTINETGWKDATELPLTLKLTNSSTVVAKATFKENDVDYTSPETSRTYILLDSTTTYLNSENTLTIGTTVNQNGMTMTYGGMPVEGKNFTKFSNVDYSEDNILGSLHAVTSTSLYLDVDAASEKNVLYNHKLVSGKALHERTFALPAMGSFYKFEPDANGELTVFVEQQGAMLKSRGQLDPTKVRKRPVYFLDETGKSIEATYAYTSSKINKADWTKVKETAVEGSESEKAYMETLKKYYNDIIGGNNKTFTNFNSAVADDKKHAKLELGTSIQPVIVLNEGCNEGILEDDTKNDGTGYMTISEGYVTYRFPVMAGKTYYLFASGTKLALSGFSFKQKESYSATDVTLDGKDNNASKIDGLKEGDQYNVTLNRSFGANKWYSVVLPFSVSQKQMKNVFGNDVKVLHYNNVTGSTLNLTEHYYQMIVGGTPVLVKPSQDVTNPVFNNVTLTSQKVVDIENSGFKCTGSWNNEDYPKYSYFINAKDSKFYQYDPTMVAAGTKAPHAGAFRAWIIAASGNPATAAKLTMHINGIEDNDETTAIWNAVIGNDDNAEVAAKGIYSLSGQKMNTTDTHSLPKGIYIVNGKKVIVK